MAQAHLEYYLNGRRRSLGFFGFFWRISILFPLLWGIICILFGLRGLWFPDVILGETDSQKSAMYYLYLADIVYGAIAMAMSLWIAFDVHRRRHSPNAFDSIPPGYQAVVNPVLNKLCYITGVPRGSLSLFYARSDLSVNASVITDGSDQCLVLTMGFIKTLKTDPTLAEAMLAHELGHFVAKDSDLYLFMTVAAQVMLFASIPLNLIALTGLTLTGNVGLLALPPTDLHTLLISFFWSAVIGLSVLVVGYFALREFRHQAELQADTFACLYSSVDGVKAYLTSAGKTAWFTLLDVHPSIGRRRRNVEYCRTLLERQGNPFFQAPPILGTVVLLSIVLVGGTAATFWLLSRNLADGLAAYKARPPAPTQTLYEPHTMPVAPQPRSLPPTERLLQAIQNRDANGIADAIRDGASANATDQYGTPALWLAAQHGNMGVVEALIRGGANVNLPNPAGGVPLTVAARYGRTEIVHTLISAGASIDFQTNAGHTALMNAAAGGKTDTVLELLRAGANFTLRDQSGNTALSEARRGGYRDAIALLQQAGATE